MGKECGKRFVLAFPRCFSPPPSREKLFCVKLSLFLPKSESYLYPFIYMQYSELMQSTENDPSRHSFPTKTSFSIFTEKSFVSRVEILSHSSTFFFQDVSINDLTLVSGVVKKKHLCAVVCRSPLVIVAWSLFFVKLIFVQRYHLKTVWTWHIISHGLYIYICTHTLLSTLTAYRWFSITFSYTISAPLSLSKIGTVLKNRSSRCHHSINKVYNSWYPRLLLQL